MKQGDKGKRTVYQIVSVKFDDVGRFEEGRRNKEKNHVGRRERQERLGLASV